jgi:hypothetical protein
MWPADFISENIKVTGISNALDITRKAICEDACYWYLSMIGTVCVAQNGSPEF